MLYQSQVLGSPIIQYKNLLENKYCCCLLKQFNNSTNYFGMKRTNINHWLLRKRKKSSDGMSKYSYAQIKICLL